MKNQILVYIAGPLFTSGRMDDNIRAALEAANKLIIHGFLPVIPHLYFFWDLITPKDESNWLELDRRWIDQCDILLRLSGDSRGADMEVKWALENKSFVYDDIDELIKDFKDK